MKLRIVFGLVSVFSLIFLGYYGYESMKEKDPLCSVIKHNVEALADDETDSSRYPKRGGKPQFCTLYVYKKGDITISVGTEENPNFEGKVEYTKEVKRGLEDKCPEKGGGCNPYSCQEVPY